MREYMHPPGKSAWASSWSRGRGEVTAVPGAGPRLASPCSWPSHASRSISLMSSLVSPRPRLSRPLYPPSNSSASRRASVSCNVVCKISTERVG